jgi:hypothetical protein
MNIVDVIELAIDDFEASNGRRPFRMKLGLKQAVALQQFKNRYTSHPAVADKAAPRYEDILIDETVEDDELKLE